MATRRANPPEDIFPSAARAESPMERWLGRRRDPATGALVPLPEKKRSASVAASIFEKTKAETARMIGDGDWEGFAARHVVALYDLMHLKAYGIEPTTTGKERHQHTLLAGSFVKRVFGGDFELALEYLRWVWGREIEREKWRRENGRQGGRLGFRLMLSSAIVDDYRLAMARKKR